VGESGPSTKKNTRDKAIARSTSFFGEPFELNLLTRNKLKHMKENVLAQV
jgi:hypothetical protein